MSQFAFLADDFPALHKYAAKAETHALSDPRGACFWARLTLETALKWIYRTDPALRRVYTDTLAAMIAEPSLEALTGPAITTKARYIKDQGNRAAHDAGKPLTAHDATASVRELFHVCYWFARTYAKVSRPDPALGFDADKLQKSLTITASTVAQIQKIEGEIKAERKRAEAAEEALRASEAGRLKLDAELAAVRAEIAALRKANSAVHDTHDYNEAETRNSFIDLLLAEAGWPLDQERDREFPVSGMPTDSGKGFVDYVLWAMTASHCRGGGQAHKERQPNGPASGEPLCRLPGDRLRPPPGDLHHHGYEHWIWDDQAYPPRAISGFLEKG